MSSTSALFNALNRETTVTENGMATLESSLDSVVDLFFKIGGSRGKFEELKPTISAAFSSDPYMTLRVLLWARDVRGGAGERQLFRDAVRYGFELGALDKETGDRIVQKIPELGRFDDLYSFIGTPCEDTALALFAGAIYGGNGLAAKWSDRKGPNAIKMRNKMGLTPKQYRKLIVKNTDVVENKMCSKNWEKIDFGKLPSLASSRYQNAFMRNAKERYLDYIENLQKGKEKINADAVYPYDVVKSLKYGNIKVAEEQWNNLPNYMEGSENSSIIPVVDVSGSMTVGINGNFSGGVTSCLDVAVSLGIYISERNEGIFKDKFITFSDDPQFYDLRGNLAQRFAQLKTSKWGFSTNFEKVFKTILDTANQHNLKQEDLPDDVLVLSDMQFNQAEGMYRGSNPTSFEIIEQLYKNAGYERPRLVYWNLRTSNGVPVEFDQNGTALVSGFSPSIMKSILGAEEFTPRKIMMETIATERYSF